jgi:hypothetical protein
MSISSISGASSQSAVAALAARQPPAPPPVKQDADGDHDGTGAKGSTGLVNIKA